MDKLPLLRQKYEKQLLRVGRTRRARIEKEGG